MSNALRQRVLTTVTDYLGMEPGKLTPDTTLQQLGLDSLRTLGLISRLEEEFHVMISDTDAIQITGLEQAVVVLDRLMAGVVSL